MSATYAGRFAIPREVAARVLLQRRMARGQLLPYIESTHRGWRTNYHHHEICEALEKVERKEVPGVVISAPPRTGKTTIASRHFPTWIMARNPGAEVMSATYSDDLASEIGRDVKGIMRDDDFGLVFSNVSIQHDASAATKFRTNQGNRYHGVSIKGRMTGKGADYLLCDDLFRGIQDADSPVIRAATWASYDADARTRLQNGGVPIHIGTRWHLEDVIGLVLKHHADENWIVLKYPAILDEGTDKECSFWPQWKSTEELQKLRDSYMRSHPRIWRALYQQEPTLDEGTYFQREWFDNRYRDLPKVAKYMSSDFAVTEAREGMDPDWTEHAVIGVGVDHDYCLDWWSGRTTADVWVEKLVDLFQKHRPLAWFGEKGVIRRVIEPLLIRRMRERNVFVRLEWITRQGGKEECGRPFQARAAMGRLRLPADQKWAEDVIDQCVGFPSLPHDDKVDALALFYMAVDQAHPAVISKPPQKKPYNMFERHGSANDWKTV